MPSLSPKDQIHPDVFKVRGQILERCSEVPKISLNPWHECQDDLPNVSTRVKRDTTTTKSFDEDDPSGERVEGLEIIMLKNKLEFQKMQRQMIRMHRTIVQMKDSAVHEKSVCVDFDGSIRSNMELWKHSHFGNCVSCLCKVCTYNQ